MTGAVPSCDTIQVVLFRGDRSGAFGARIKRELDEQKNGLGPGPAALDTRLGSNVWACRCFLSRRLQFTPDFTLDEE